MTTSKVAAFWNRRAQVTAAKIAAAFPMVTKVYIDGLRVENEIAQRALQDGPSSYEGHLDPEFCMLYGAARGAEQRLREAEGSMFVLYPGIRQQVATHIGMPLNEQFHQAFDMAVGPTWW